MNYQKIYDSLIQRARSRRKEPGIFYERHHIVPKCMGGGNESENISLLTPEEHFLAHQLLVKMYPYHKGLIVAATSMARSNNETRNTNKIYGWLRRLESESKKGIRLSEETRGKMSESKKGKKRKPFSEETRKKMSEARSKIIMTEETRSKISKSNTGRKHSEETRLKIKQSWIKRKEKSVILI